MRLQGLQKMVIVVRLLENQQAKARKSSDPITAHKG